MSSPVYTFRDAKLRSPLLLSVNGIGSALGAIGVKLPELSAEVVVAAAKQRSQTDLFPDTATSDALSHYIESARADAHLNTLGRLAVKDMLTNSMASQFSVLEWHAQHPDLEKEVIRSPWIIVGLPRTGTSILSILLGLNPQSRPIRQWEARRPIPPAGLAEASEDPRIAEATAQFDQLKQLNPAIATMHPFGSTLAEECTAVFTYSLRTIGMETIAFVPGYGNWLDEADMGPAYAIHRKTLQAMQRAQPTGHWVLKSPNHLWCLPAMLNAYPDARVIWTHRDPSRVLPSLASLNCAMQTQFTTKLAPQQVGEYWAGKLERALAKATNFDAAQRGGWCYHLQYKALMADPLAAVSAIYDCFGSAMSDLHRQRISTWLAQKPQHADGIHAYDSADFGWSTTSLRDRFKDYQDHYDVPPE